MDRIKRLSFEVLNDHKTKFGEDFTENKKALNQISIIRSKGLKNKVAGYITRFNKKQTLHDHYNQDNVDSSNTDEQDSSLEITGSEDISETVEEITLTNEDVEEINATNDSVEEKSE